MTDPREEEGRDNAEDARKREFRGSFADHDDPNRQEEWTLLRTLPPSEAALLRDRLEAAGLPCELQEEAIEPEPGERRRLKVLVLHEDLDAARDVASSEASVDADDPADEQEDPAERERRLLANWQCPRCARQKLELLPRKRWWHHLFVAFLAILVMPILTAIVFQIVADRQLLTTFNDQADRLAWPWILTVIVLACALVMPQRDRRCKACGWDSRHPNLTPSPTGASPVSSASDQDPNDDDA